MFSPMRILSSLQPISRDAAYALMDFVRYINDTLTSIRSDLKSLKDLTTPEEPEELTPVDIGGVDVDVSGQNITGGIEVRKHSFLYELRWRHAGEKTWRTILQSDNRFILPRSGDIEAEIRYLPSPLGKWSKWAKFDIPLSLPEGLDVEFNNDDLVVESKESKNVLTWPNIVLPQGHIYEWRIYKGISSSETVEPDDASLVEVGKLSASLQVGYVDQEDVLPTLTWSDTEMRRYYFAKYKVALYSDGQELGSYTAWPVSMSTQEYFYFDYVAGSGASFEVASTCDTTDNWTFTNANYGIAEGTKIEGVGAIWINTQTAGTTAVAKLAKTYTTLTQSTLKFYFMASGAGLLDHITVKLFDSGGGTVFTSSSIDGSNTSYLLKAVPIPALSFSYIQFEFVYKSGKAGRVYIDYITIEGQNTRTASLWFYGNNGYGKLFPWHPQFSQWGLHDAFDVWKETYDTNKTWTVPSSEIWRIMQYYMTASTNILMADDFNLAEGAVSGSPQYDVGPGAIIQYTRGTGGGRIQIVFAKATLPPHVTFRRRSITTTSGYPTNPYEYFFLVENASGSCQMNFDGTLRNVGTPLAGFFTSGAHPLYAYSGTVYLRGYTIIL